MNQDANKGKFLRETTFLKVRTLKLFVVSIPLRPYNCPKTVAIRIPKTAPMPYI